MILIKRKISLELNNDPVQDYLDKQPIKSKVTGRITEINEKYLKVELDKENNIFGYVKRQNLSKDKNEQRTDRFALEENIDSTIMSLDSKTRSINLSIKELEIQDEKEALDKYGSSDSGASLDILGSVLKNRTYD